MEQLYSAGSGYDVGYVCDEVSETFSYQLHSHEGIFEILYMEEGDASFWVEGTIYKMSPGDIAIARSDEMHLMRHNSKTIYKRLVINANSDFFEENNCTDYLAVFNDRAVGVGNHFSAETVKESGLAEIIERLKKYVAKDEKPLVKSALTEFFYTLNTLPERESSESLGVVRDVVLYINQHITHPLSLDTLADRFYISKYYLCRQFKKRMGIGVVKYITHKRILLVRDLYSSGKSLTDACIEAGFGDYSSFYVAYKKMNGTSPKNILR
ncbi:MAG: helix-turn-helix transcriptional regulator [Clostridia bacterium]|nr:helix-turn-helix transcriptional regulator [Clostridia bacterium]